MIGLYVKMKKVIIYQGIVPHYRKPIFDIIGQYVDLTLVYTGDIAVAGNNYSLVKLSSLHVPKMGTLHGRKLIGICQDKDVLISMLGPSSLDIDNIKLLCPHIRTIKWGIGVPASYTTRFDEEDAAQHYIKIIKKCDAALFYSDYPRNKYISMGVPGEKLFVANNTVAVEKIEIQPTRKRNILFIGSLYSQKRVDLLINAYFKAYSIKQNLPNLIIIGDGDQRKSLEKQVNEYNLENKILFLGQINDDYILKEYFVEALACISPDQAGLSVLKSMGYGVPFVTCKGAITGGEIFNIHNGVDGVVLDSLDSLYKIILDIASNREKYIEYGKKAISYYYAKRTPEIMAQGFLDAIEYVTTKK